MLNKHNQLESAMQHNQKQLLEKKHKLLTMDDKHASLLERNKQLIKSNQSDTGLIHSLQQKLNHNEGQLHNLKTTLKQAEDNLANTNHKNLFLTQENTELKFELKHLQKETP